MFSQLTRYAAELDVQIDDANMDIRITYDTRGKLLLDDTSPAAQQAEYVLEIKSPAPTERVAERARVEGAGVVVISAAIEAEVAGLADPAERQEFLDGLGLEETGLNRVIRAGYALLDLITFFSATEKEARAWTVRDGTRAAAAAGVIHSDFEKGFIAAETIPFDDYVALGGEHGAREAGRMRLEGRDYVVRDGDVLRFRFNV